MPTDQITTSYLKGALSRIFSISFKEPQYDLCRGKPKSVPFLLTSAVFSALKLLATVCGCRWPGWKWTTN